MKLYDSNLKAFIIASNCLNGVLLPGKVGFAVAKTKAKIESAFNHYTTATQNALKAVAVKDKEGEFALEEASEQQQNYTFETPEAKAEVIKEVEVIGNIEVEIEAHKADEELLMNIPNITPEQMHYALILTGNLEA